LTVLGADFTTLQGDITRTAARMRASTPENVRFAQTYQKIIQEFESGKITSKQAADQLDKLQTEMKQTGAAAQTSRKDFKLFWTELNSGIMVVKQAAQAIIRTGKAIYDFGKSGAVLENVEFKFERLALTIGSTGDAITKGLDKALEGLLSQADQMKLVTDLLSLGLVKTEDQAIRLGSVVGQMGMDTNELVLTLTNRTLRRFDQLGVATDGFKERLKGLEDQGLDTEAAFTEAFLQQAEAQLEKVGGLADQNIGSFMKLEASVKDLADTAKRKFAPAIIPIVEYLNNWLTATEELDLAVRKRIITQDEENDLMLQVRSGYITYAEMLDILAAKTDEYNRLSGVTQLKYIGMNEALPPVIEGMEELTVATSEQIDYLSILDEVQANFELSVEARNETLRESTTETQNATTAFFGLAQSLVEVGKAEYAKTTLDAITAAYQAGDIPQEAYEEGVRNVLLAFGLATPESLALADAVGLTTEAIVDGKVAPEDWAMAMDIANEASKDGAVDAEELAIAFDEAGILIKDAADEQLDPATKRISEMSDAFLLAGDDSETATEIVLMQTRMIANRLPGDMRLPIAKVSEFSDYWMELVGAKKDLRFTVKIDISEFTTRQTYSLDDDGDDDNGDDVPPWIKYTASGGPVKSNVPVIVGDAGRPEVFVPGSDGYIFPSIGEFEQMFARAGGRGSSSNTNNFNLNMNVQNANQNTVQRSFEMMRLFTR